MGGGDRPRGRRGWLVRRWSKRRCGGSGACKYMPILSQHVRTVVAARSSVPSGAGRGASDAGCSAPQHTTPARGSASRQAHEVWCGGTHHGSCFWALLSSVTRSAGRGGVAFRLPPAPCQGAYVSAAAHGTLADIANDVQYAILSRSAGINQLCRQTLTQISHGLSWALHQGRRARLRWGRW